jgi:hypothetical protein
LSAPERPVLLLALPQQGCRLSLPPRSSSFASFEDFFLLSRALIFLFLTWPCRASCRWRRFVCSSASSLSCWRGYGERTTGQWTAAGAGKTYIGEGAGNIIGGILFTLLLVHLLHAFQIVASPARSCSPRDSWLKESQESCGEFLPARFAEGFTVLIFY